MKENNRKEKDLQSRREFFKSAAKVSLPVLGAMMLSQFPMTSCSIRKGPYMIGRNESKVRNCHGTCTTSCAQRCSFTCASDCGGACVHLSN